MFACKWSETTYQLAHTGDAVVEDGRPRALEMSAVRVAGTITLRGPFVRACEKCGVLRCASLVVHC